MAHSIPAGPRSHNEHRALGWRSGRTVRDASHDDIPRLRSGFACRRATPAAASGDTHRLQPITLADVLESTRSDFGGQERIGNARARRADDVALAAAQCFHHVIGAGEPAVADDRHRRADDGLHVRHEGPHPVRLAKARAPRILAPFLVIADLDGPTDRTRPRDAAVRRNADLRRDAEPGIRR